MAKGSNKGYLTKLRYARAVHRPRIDNHESYLLSQSYDPSFILSLIDYSILDQNDAYLELLAFSGYSPDCSLTHIIPKYQPNGRKSMSILQEYRQELLISQKAKRFTLYINDLIHEQLTHVEVTVSPLIHNESTCFCTLRKGSHVYNQLDKIHAIAQPRSHKKTKNIDSPETVSIDLLLQKLNEYQSIVNSSPAAIIKTDLLGTINFVSSQTNYIHGLSEEQLLYKHIDEFFTVNGKSFFSLLKRKLEDQKKGEGRKILNITHPIKGIRVIELKYYSLKNEGQNGYLLSYIDITEKENFKSSLEHSQAKLESLIGFSNSDILQLDIDGTIESISSTVNVSSQPAESNILGEKFSSFIAPEAHEKLNIFLTKILQESEEDISEFFEIQFPRQAKKQIQVQGKVLLDNLSNKASILLICHNCTDKVKTEIALREKESTLHTLLENSPFSIYAIDKQFNVIFINKNAIEDFKNYQKIDIQLGDNLKHIVPEDLLNNWKNKVFSRVFSGDKFSRSGLINGVKDVIIENKYSPLIDHLGNVTGCVEVSQDITDLKLKEYQLIEREAYLSSLLNSSPNGILVFDNDYNVTGTNPMAVDNFKTIYDHEIKVESNLKTILPKDIFKTIHQIQKRVFQGEIVTYVEKVINNNECFYFKHTYSPVKDKNNSIIGCKLLLLDETKVIEFEDILRDKNKELERYIESNISLENFANIASHDLKSPLRTIIGFTQLLEREIKDDLSDKNKVFFSHIVKSSKNMQALIDDILLFSKLNAVEPTLDEIVFQPLIDFTISQIQDEVNETNSTIKFKNIPQFIKTDHVKLGQVLQNLIRNGIKFKRPNTLPEITISVVDQESNWQINVEDNGIGIEDKHADEIFKIFKRLHRKGTYPGSGIGLSTCQKIVESLGGKIWVNSIVGKGSTFSFTIPK